MKLFDTHLLLGLDHWLAANKPELAHQSDVAALVDAMDLTGADLWRAAVFPFPSCEDSSYVAENEFVLASTNRDARLLPVVVANPINSTNFEWVMDRLGSGLVRGLMIWPILSDLNLLELHGHTELWQRVERYEVPVTLHVGVGNETLIGRAVRANRYDPSAAVTLAAALPRVRFNLSHVLRLSRSALAVAGRLPNVMLDVSGLSALGRWFEADTEVFPAADRLVASSDPVNALRVLTRIPQLRDRLMFGSSWPFSSWWGFNPTAEIKMLSEAVPEAMFETILWENPCRFYAETA